MNILLFVLVLFGLLFIFAIAYYFVRRHAEHEAKVRMLKQRTPPLDYMKYVGVKCPDYWEYMGKDPDNKDLHMCKNTFNVGVNDNTCYDDVDNKVKKFPKVEWRLQGKHERLKGDAVQQICKWRKQCGPQPKKDASWLGVESWFDCQGIYRTNENLGDDN